MPQATVNGTQLYYERTGAGAPPLVFVHGFGCAHEDWQPQVDAFGARHMVVTCDLRGHGASPGEPGSCNIETYGADVAALARALNPGGAAVGHSMGTGRADVPRCADRVKSLAVDGSFHASAPGRGGRRRVIASAGYAAWAGGLSSSVLRAERDGARASRGRAAPGGRRRSSADGAQDA
jgi:pimeloyl-ACP methyl ester carboxylesterase